MEISAAIPPERVQSLQPANRPVGGAKSAREVAKLKESCTQFEAVLWRSVLEKSGSAMLGGEDASSSDKTGTYQYFLNNTLANAVSGLPSSFSSILFSQLSCHLKTGPATANNPT
jgi:hypothetical protein